MSAYGINVERTRQEQLIKAFRLEFGRNPQYFFSAPARVELMGGHTEHNFGRGLFSTIAFDLLCAVSPRTDNQVEIRSESFAPISFSVRDLESREREKGRAIALVRGILRYFRLRGYSFQGFSVYMDNRVFRVTNSYGASLAIVITQILNSLYFDGKASPMECAMAGNYAENRCFGRSGLLSDFASVVYGGCHFFNYGAKEPIVKLNFPAGYKVVFTEIAGGNHLAQAQEIKREMLSVAAYFGRSMLREVPFATFRDSIAGLRQHVGERAALTAMYYYEECDRTEYAAEALAKNDMGLFLRLMRRSGESELALLRDRSEYDDRMEFACRAGNYLLKEGACRMAFGAMVSIVKEEEEHGFIKAISRIAGRESVYSTSLRSSGCIKTELK